MGRGSSPQWAGQTAEVWDVRFATMSTKNLLAETCARWLVGISILSRDDMRLLGYSDDQPEIDVCARAFNECAS